MAATAAVRLSTPEIMMSRILVATGGWSVPAWYPEGVEPRDRLRSLAERVDAVEVDSSFYALPARRTVERWAEITPDGFAFAVKLHRALSRHAAPIKSLPTALRDDVEVTERGRVVLDDRLEQGLLRATLDVFEPLHAAGRLVCFLLQLTPGFRPPEHELDELDAVVQTLAPVPVAIELRHTGWLGDINATLGWFRSAGAVWVDVDAPRTDAPVAMPPADDVTRSDLAYLRAHGRNTEGYLKGRSAAERFDYRYPTKELWELADRARKLGHDAERVLCVLSNGGHALASAEKLRGLL
jgi:uncharacterized protein YecE (DUF72 family)